MIDEYEEFKKVKENDIYDKLSYIQSKVEPESNLFESLCDTFFDDVYWDYEKGELEVTMEYTMKPGHTKVNIKESTLNRSLLYLSLRPELQNDMDRDRAISFIQRYIEELRRINENE